jgi:hypothetical protein
VIRGLTRTEPSAVNHFDGIVARLEAAWPEYQVWYVPKAVGGLTWCARRWDGTGDVINADSPDELEAMLRLMKS